MPLFFVLLATALVRVADRLELLISERRRSPLQISRWALPLLILLAIISMNRNPGPLGLGGYLLSESPPGVEENEMNVRRGLLARRITRPEASIGVTWAGATPYFARRNTIDFHGKTDPRVARLPMIEAPPGADPLRWFLPGHQKLDYAYSIGELRPDLVLSVWWSLGDPGKHLRGAYRAVTVDGLAFYVLDGSPKIRWAALK